MKNIKKVLKTIVISTLLYVITIFSIFFLSSSYLTDLFSYEVVDNAIIGMILISTIIFFKLLNQKVKPLLIGDAKRDKQKKEDELYNNINSLNKELKTVIINKETATKKGNIEDATKLRARQKSIENSIQIAENKLHKSLKKM